jgi:hypothetical protein
MTRNDWIIRLATPEIASLPVPRTIVKFRALPRALEAHEGRRYAAEDKVEEARPVHQSGEQARSGDSGCNRRRKEPSD